MLKRGGLSVRFDAGSCYIELYIYIYVYTYIYTYVYIYIYILSPLIQHCCGCCGKVFSQPRLVDEDCSCWRQIPVNWWQITWMDRAGNCMKQTWPKKEQTGHFQTRSDKAFWCDCKSYETKRYTELENWEAALKQPESYNLNRLHQHIPHFEASMAGHGLPAGGSGMLSVDAQVGQPGQLQGLSEISPLKRRKHRQSKYLTVKAEPQHRLNPTSSSKA